MNKNTKLKLRSEKGSVQGEPLSASYLQDSSFSNDERASIERSNSVRGAYGGTSGLNYTGPVYFQSQMLASPQYGTGQPIAYMLPHLDPMPNPREAPIFPPMLQFLQFKTIECTVKSYHDHKQCPLFHSSKDRRRCPQKYRYEPDLCPQVAASKVCSKYENCNYSHSTVEQFYHPKKFKTKFCSGIMPGSKGGKCIYGSFCSFAHSEDELRIKKLHQMQKTPDFFRYQYKTVYCPFSHQHDKSACEYAHNVQDYRRDPTTTAYLPETCRKWNGSAEISKYEDGGCNYNEACNKCHGWKELEYHPKFYKTKQCTHGEKCSRADCGYLHPNEKSNQTDDFYSERKLKESVKDSITSASIRAKGKLTVSQSQFSSSKDDRLLTFNSSSRSVLGKNDSLMVKKDENDRADLDSIVGEPQPMKLHARTELGNHEEDDSADDSLYNDGRNVRKFSVETVIGGSEDRFLLKSETPKLDFSKTFISPLKLMRFYGPKSPLESKTMTASPSMSSLTLTSQTDDETLDRQHLAINIMQKHSLTEASLLHEDFPELHQYSTIPDGEMKHLLSWRDGLLDGKREKDLRQIIEDYPVQDKCFKKW